MKIVKGVVKVIAIVASIAALIPGPHQPIAAIVATVASAVSAALEIIAPYKAKPNMRGSPTEYRLDPQAGIPMMLGRTQFAGNCVKRETWGSDNKYQCMTTVYSLGPIDGFEKFTADRQEISFNASKEAIGSLAGFMWFISQVGLTPSPVMDPPIAGYPGWTANHKMSGLAASHLVMKWDKKGKKYQGGAPTPGVVARGVKVYDPRKDSTYPGGSGTCRALNESTYVYSTSPHLHALTFALGRYQNGKRRFGLGFPITSIDVEYFVNGANTDELNGWEVGGLIYSNDNKWNALKQILEAGGGAPMMLGGRLSGLQSAPRIPIPQVIEESDLVGRCSVIPAQTMRERVNTGIPRFRSEQHGWETITAAAVNFSNYEAEDGERKSTEFEWHLVHKPDQAAELTAYMVANSRELGPIELTLRPRWVGLRPGDCVIVNVPSLGLVNQRCIVTNRNMDTSDASVSLTLKSETDEKHDFVLGRTAELPPIPDLSANYYATPPAPAVGSWALSVGALTSASGRTPSLRFTGSVTSDSAESVELAIRKVGDVDWSVVLPSGGPETTRFDETAVNPGTQYEGRVRYFVGGRPSDPLYLSPVTVDAAIAATATLATSIVGQGALATQNYVIVGDTIRDSSGNVLDDAALLNQENVYAPRITYHFNANEHGWAAANATVSATSTVVTLTSTTNDPTYTKPGLNVDGSKHHVIRARVRRISGPTDWEGVCYYSTSGHGFTSNFRKNIARPANWSTNGAWSVVEWDMSNLTVGDSSDYLDNIITNLRLDLPSASGVQFQIDWITIGDKSIDLLLARGVSDGADVTSDVSPVGNGNRLRYSLFESGTIGWDWWNETTPTTITRNKANNSEYVYILYSGTFTGAGQYAYMGTGPTAGQAGSGFSKTICAKVVPGERVFIGGRVSMTAPAGTSWRLNVRWFDSAGGHVSDQTIATGTTDPNFSQQGGFTTVPATAMYASIFMQLVCGAATGAFSGRLAEPMLCAAGASQTAFPPFTAGPSGESGADVTSVVEGIASSSFKYDYTGTTAEGGEFPRELSYKLRTGLGYVGSDVGWTYTVKTGSVNGFTSASGAQAMTGTGVGVLTINSLGASTSTVEIKALHAGSARTFIVTLTKQLAEQPINPGGGGLTTIASKTSGFISISSSTFTDVTGTMTGTMPTGKTTAKLSFSLSADPGVGAGSGPWTVEAKLQRLISGTWTDRLTVASGQSNTEMMEVEPDVYEKVVNPAYLSKSGDDTGLTAGTAYSWRVVARVSAGGTRTHSITGTVTVAA